MRLSKPGELYYVLEPSAGMELALFLVFVCVSTCWLLVPGFLLVHCDDVAIPDISASPLCRTARPKVYVDGRAGGRV